MTATAAAGGHEDLRAVVGATTGTPPSCTRRRQKQPKISELNECVFKFCFLIFLRPVDAAGRLLGSSAVAESVTTPRFGANG